MKANSGYGSKICGYETYPSKAQRTQPNEYHVDVTMQKGILRPNRESKTPIRDSYPNIYEFDQQQYPTLQKLPVRNNKFLQFKILFALNVTINIFSTIT